MRLFESIMTRSAEEGVDADNETNSTEKISSVEKLPKQVYYIESPNDDTVLVGINVTIKRDKMYKEDVFKINWYDTFYERGMTAAEIRMKGDRFAFHRIEQEGGGYYYFSPMNLDIYNDKVKKKLLSGGNFANNDDLIKAFLSTTKNEFN